MKRKFILLFCTLLPFFTFSQQYEKNTKGAVVIKGEFNSSVKVNKGTMYLYELKGNDEYILDSTNVQSRTFAFSKRSLQTGIYRLTFNNSTNALDIVVNSQETDLIDIKLSNYKIKKGYNVVGSIENKIKKSYDIKEASIQQKLKLVRKSSKSRDEKLSEMRALNNELYDFGSALHEENPGTYFGMIISQMQSQNTYISHLYFNDIDFTDECIVRSALLPTRIQTYFQNHSNWPDNKYGFHDAIDMVMQYAVVNDEVAEFCMYNMLDGFYNTGQTDRKNNPIWQDLCNYIMDEYIFGEGCGDDIEPSQLLKERASHFKNLQLGSVPPNFNAKDINGKNINLQKTCASNKYTVLMFWASHCQHCMAELPGFANWYNSYGKNDIEMIAVSLDGNKKNWESAINNNNFNWTNICQFKVYKSPICLDFKIKKTPTMFVFNNKMEIVAKPRSTHQLKTFLMSNK
tara:strand:- start:980 stop:2356 length:1377 start_codon:yes stop_codon:yes gene_type:complete